MSSVDWQMRVVVELMNCSCSYPIYQNEIRSVWYQYVNAVKCLIYKDKNTCTGLSVHVHVICAEEWDWGQRYWAATSNILHQQWRSQAVMVPNTFSPTLCSNFHIRGIPVIKAWPSSMFHWAGVLSWRKQIPSWAVSSPRKDCNVSRDIESDV